MSCRVGALLRGVVAIALGACGAHGADYTAPTPVKAGCYHAEHSMSYPLGASSGLPDSLAGAWLELHPDTLPGARHRRKATAFDRFANTQTGDWQWADDRLLLDLHDGFTSTHLELRVMGDSLVGDGSGVTDVVEWTGLARRDHWTAVIHAMKCADRPPLKRTPGNRGPADSAPTRQR